MLKKQCLHHFDDFASIIRFFSILLKAILICDPFLSDKQTCFNNLRPAEAEKRNKLIIKLFGKTSAKFHIEPPFRCDYGYNIEIGENFYANYNLIILDCAKVIIGDNVFIAPNVGIYTAGHPLHFDLRNQEYEYALPVTIGNNVWLGGNVVINPGIKIGDNAVIGSGSIITKDIPEHVLAFGNPCKMIRQITDADKNYYYKDFPAFYRKIIVRKSDKPAQCQ